MMPPLYVGFFTVKTPYQYEAVECMKSLDAFGLEHEFIGVLNRGDWTKNCAQKPEAIWRLMQKHDGRPIVYVDADARIRRKPILFDSLDCDFAAHWRHGVELLSGTLYFGPTRAARELVSAWCDTQVVSPGEWDQKTLQRVVESGIVPNVRVDVLPATYTAIFDDPKMQPAVIEHMQASRRHKVAVG